MKATEAVEKRRVEGLSAVWVASNPRSAGAHAAEGLWRPHAGDPRAMKKDESTEEEIQN